MRLSVLVALLQRMKWLQCRHYSTIVTTIAIATITNRVFMSHLLLAWIIWLQRRLKLYNCKQNGLFVPHFQTYAKSKLRHGYRWGASSIHRKYLILGAWAKSKLRNLNTHTHTHTHICVCVCVNNRNCASSYSADMLTILSKSHSDYHLKMLETIHILTHKPSLCKQKMFIGF